LFVVVQFKDYIGPIWDQNNPKYVPITPLYYDQQRKMPLKMAWALIIHKSQGLTIEKETIDIGNTDHQGLTFIIISRVYGLSCLQIHLAFIFPITLKISKLPLSAF